MDLSDILYRRTKKDLEIANARLLAMSFEADALSKEVLYLRNLVAAASAAGASNDPEPGGDTEAPAPEQSASAVTDGSFETENVAQPPARPRKQAERLPWTKRLFGNLLAAPKEGPKLHWHLDEICGEFPDRSAGDIRVSVSATGAQALTMSGWIVPVPGGEPFQSVEISLDDGSRVIVKGTKAYYRPDVQAHFPDLDLRYSGFRFEVPMFELRRGEHIVRITGRTEAGQAFDEKVGTVIVA